MVDIKSRIDEYMLYRNIKPGRFEVECGLSNGYWKKTKNISAEVLVKIVSVYPEINLNWLLRGEGEMLVNLDQKVNVDGRVITTGDNSAAGDGSQVVVHENHGVGHIILESVNKLLNMDCLDATHVDRVLALMEKYAKE